MNEFSIEWIKGQQVATVSFPNSSKLKNTIVKLAEQYPDEVDYIENEDGSIYGHIPVKYVAVRHPRVMSDAQKEAAAERLKAMRGASDE